MQAIILAAGVGKRLKTITDQRPKCLIEIGGKTLLARHLDTRRRGCGFSKTVRGTRPSPQESA
jgi:NDP-sugar pyrophosphorylase family protein